LSDPVFIAPGKLVIAGDYAVLDGAPAISIAIDRGVRCTVKIGQGISTPMGDDRFVKPALQGLELKHRFVFEEENPIRDIEGKPGFGGSAAACVTACLAAGRPATDALRIHRNIQGSGSGIDVLTAIHGGSLRIANGEVTPIQIPDPIVIWSGRSSKTGPKVIKYLQQSQRERFVAESEKWTVLFPENPIKSTRQLYRLLSEMTLHAGIDYLTPELEEISKIAESCGGGCKPSGAGGGDCAIAFFNDPRDTQRFQAKLEGTGYKTIPVTISKGGRRIESKS